MSPVLTALSNAALQQRMVELRTEIVVSVALDPDNFDEREKLWMERETIRAQLEGCA